MPLLSDACLPRVLAAPVVWALCSAAALADPTDTAQAEVTVSILPTVELEILGTPLLYLQIPPAGSTIPNHGVSFAVTGNAGATVIAEPDAFITVPTVDYPGGEHLGKAILNGNSVGYRLRLDFPSTGAPGSPQQYAALPGYQDGPTEPPLSVNLVPTGGVRNGRIHMEANPDWTPTGGLPLPGVYVGSVILTVSAY